MREVVFKKCESFLPSVEIGGEQNGRTQKANKHPVNSDILELVLEN